MNVANYQWFIGRYLIKEIKEFEKKD